MVSTEGIAIRQERRDLIVKRKRLCFAGATVAAKSTVANGPGNRPDFEGRENEFTFLERLTVR